MTTIAPQPLEQHRAWTPYARAGLALLLLASACALTVVNTPPRVWEARLATPLITWATQTDALAVAGQPEILIGVGSSWSRVLEVSVMCSAAVLLVPVLVVGAVLALPRQIEPGRLLAALGVCAAAILATNTLRILVVALCMQRWGAGRGYVLAHDTLGTLISLVGVGVALLLFVRLTVGRLPRLTRTTRSGRPVGRRRA